MARKAREKRPGAVYHVLMRGGEKKALLQTENDCAYFVSQVRKYREDSDLELWFDHSFRKNFTSDTTSTGKDTYSIYMAKNEKESAQFVLYSDTDMPGMTAEVSDFEDGDGEALILKDLSNDEDKESLYAIVDDDTELKAVAGVFEGLLDDVEFVTDDEK